MSTNAATLDRERWRRIWRLATGRDGDAVFQRVAAHYAEPHRHYHHAGHIMSCLRGLDTIAGPASDPVALELAIWLHDVIYDPRRTDNEEQSAAFAVAAITSDGGTSALAGDVATLIRSTIRHQPGVHPDSGTLLDIDLAILGQPPEVFVQYERAVAREYAWVSAQEFRQRRASILAAFLARPQIYLTFPFAERFERAARANLAWSLEELRR